MKGDKTYEKNMYFRYQHPFRPSSLDNFPSAHPKLGAGNPGGADYHFRLPCSYDRRGCIFSCRVYKRKSKNRIYADLHGDKHDIWNCRNCAGRAYAVYRFRIRQIPYPGGEKRSYNESKFVSPHLDISTKTGINSFPFAVKEYST